MKRIYKLFLLMTAIVMCWSCNDEWTKEQYVHWVSVKAPLSDGVTPIRVRYKPEGKVTYNLPMIVSGSTINPVNMTINIGLFTDTLEVLNRERFGNREELYYQELPSKFYELPSTAKINAGEYTGLIPIDFSLAGLDMVDKWLLPIDLKDGNGYDLNYRRHYKKAMLRVIPFSDYSGTYSATLYKVYFKGAESEGIIPEWRTSYVVDDETVFFYAGLVDEDRLDRKYYKTFFKFTDELHDIESRKLQIWTDNPDIELKVKDGANYSIHEKMDETRPYIKHVFTTLYFEYEYKDYTSVQGAELNYIVKGSLIMERVINTQIPDEDQAIEW